MPFCPKCKYEYVEGIETCPDCDLKLVPALPEERKTEPADLIVVARFMFSVEADLAKMRLDMEGIDCFLSGQMVSTIGPGPLLEPFEIKLTVREEDAERARQVLSDKMQE